MTPFCAAETAKAVAFIAILLCAAVLVNAGAISGAMQ